MRKITLLQVFLFSFFLSQSQITREIFSFEFEGLTLQGVLNMPEQSTPKGIVLLVHGSGQTNAVAQEWHYDVRATLVKSGYATFMWDKIGCGQSEGSFDYNQPVQNSAEEVLAAINSLKSKQIPGSDHIAFWGISRAGWIIPLVLQTFKEAGFWISVSGVDEKENFKYLLEENLRIDGLSEDKIELIIGEWVRANQITHSGHSFERWQAATQNLEQNPFILRFRGGSEVTEAGYYAYQKSFMKEELEYETGLQVYIKDFESILSEVYCPVLALFGEKDKNVDWRKTKALYERTLGRQVDLTIQTFPDANHNLFQCKTG
ncbi:MAG: alpha/beta fold hydrolase, partial [Bacteroidota bacterium]